MKTSAGSIACVPTSSRKTMNAGTITVRVARKTHEALDISMVEAQQRAIGAHSFWDMKPVLLDVDGPGIRARRVLEKLIADEQAVAFDVHTPQP